ncbi:hypothetical protein ACLI4Y_08660 [Natrialbaceae archaeon A-CW3]
MSDRYETPESGTEDWHVPLNENFRAIGTDVETLEAGKSNEGHDHEGEVISPASTATEELDGDLVSRSEPITQLAGNIVVTDDSSVEPENDGDLVFYVE